MKTRKIKVLGILLTGFLFAVSMPAASQAAGKKPVLSKEKIGLTEGKNQKLSVKNKAGYTISWKSNRKSVAAVSKNGVVKAKKRGAAKITAVARNDKTGKAVRLICKVTVSGKSVQAGDSRGEADPAANGTKPVATAKPAGTMGPATTEKPAGTEETPAPNETGATVVATIDTTDAETLFCLEHQDSMNRDIFDNQILFSYEQLQDMIRQLKGKMPTEEVSWGRSYEIREMVKRLEEIDAEFFQSNALCVGAVELAQRGYDFTVDFAEIRDRAGKKELSLILEEYWALPPDQCVTCDCVYYSCFVRMPRELIQGCDSVVYALLESRNEEIYPQLPPHYTTTTPEAVTNPSTLDTGIDGDKAIEGRAYSFASDFPVLENRVVSDYGTLQEIIAQVKRGADRSGNKELLRQLESYEEDFFKNNSLILASQTETYGYTVHVRSVTVEEQDGNRVLHCNLQKQWTAGDCCVACVMIYHNFVLEVPSSSVSAADKITVHPAVETP